MGEVYPVDPGFFCFSGDSGKEEEMPRPSRNDIYEAVIRRMVTQALEEQEERFMADHGGETEQQLLEHIRQQAQLLGYAPRYQEIVGWKLMLLRFGSWEQALKKAGLEPLPNCPVSRLARVEAEVHRQKELYRQKKAEKKLRSQQRLKEQKEKKKHEPKP